MLFGDSLGIPQLLRHIPSGHIVGIVGAVIRPQYHADLARRARECDVPFFVQPRPADDAYAAFRRHIAECRPDLIWVNSYSMIVREDILALAPLGGINLHPSLLPAYRGCNPFQWSIIDGQRETGVSLHVMTAGLDEGPVIDQRRIPIMFEDSWMALRDRTFEVMDELIATQLPRILSGRWNAVPQDETRASYGRRRKPEDGEFFWSEPVLSICNKVRALLPPLPPAYWTDAQGQHVEQHSFATPMSITVRKYGREGGHKLVSGTIRLRPLNAGDRPRLELGWPHSGPILTRFPFADIQGEKLAGLGELLEIQLDAVIFCIELEGAQAPIGIAWLHAVEWGDGNSAIGVLLQDPNALDDAGIVAVLGLLRDFGIRELALRGGSFRAQCVRAPLIDRLTLAGFEPTARRPKMQDKAEWQDATELRFVLPEGDC